MVIETSERCGMRWMREALCKVKSCIKTDNWNLFAETNFRLIYIKRIICVCSYHGVISYWILLYPEVLAYVASNSAPRSMSIIKV